MKKDVVLIVTDKDEQSVPKVTGYLQEINQPFFRFNVSSFAELQSRIIVSIKSSALTGFIQCGDGTKISIEDVKSIWFRRPKPILVSRSMPSAEKKFTEDEFKSSLWSLYTCFDSVY